MIGSEPPLFVLFHESLNISPYFSVSTEINLAIVLREFIRNLTEDHGLKTVIQTKF